MAKQVNYFHVEYLGDVGNTNPTSARIHYIVGDTVDTDLQKNVTLEVTVSPETVTWADAESRIKTAEGIV